MVALAWTRDAVAAVTVTSRGLQRVGSEREAYGGRGRTRGALGGPYLTPRCMSRTQYLFARQTDLYLFG